MCNGYDIDGNAGSVASDGHDIADYTNSIRTLPGRSSAASCLASMSTGTRSTTITLQRSRATRRQAGFTSAFRKLDVRHATDWTDWAPQLWIGGYYEAQVFGFADIENARGGSGCYDGLARFKSGEPLLIVLSRMARSEMTATPATTTTRPILPCCYPHSNSEFMKSVVTPHSEASQYARS